MMSGTLESVDGRPALRFERRLAHPVERVWRAVTDPDELARWFVASVPWTPAAGETFTAMEQAGEITEVTPPRRIAWTWGGEAFSFDVAPDGDGCRLVFVHVFGDRSLGAQHAAGWEAYFARLDAHLRGEFPVRAGGARARAGAARAVRGAVRARPRGRPARARNEGREHVIRHDLRCERRSAIP
jgi:uncharacterized protein YndB with AHSA1/START domain